MREQKKQIGIQAPRLSVDRYTPRTLLNERIIKLHHLILDLLMSLDVRGLDKIKEEFQQHPEGELDLEEFVELMLTKCHSSVVIGRADVVEALVELFDSMDLDGNSVRFLQRTPTIMLFTSFLKQTSVFAKVPRFRRVPGDGDSLGSYCRWWTERRQNPR